MKKIILFAFILLTFSNCSNDDEQPANVPVNLDFTTLKQADANPNRSNPINPLHYVLHNQAEYDLFMQATDVGALAVDFAANDIVVVFGDYSDETGYKIEISSIVQTDDQVVVTYKKTGEGILMLGGQPYQAVKISKTNFPVVFLEDTP